MTQMTRKDLLRTAAASAVIVGWDPLTRGWATAASRRRGLHAVPALDGVLLTDSVSRRLAAEDWAHFVHREPAAVLRPVSVDDVVKIVRYARERRIPVAMRGQAHSCFGQSQALGGIVIDSATLCRIHSIEDDRAIVDPGVLWRTLVSAGVARGVTPPALTDYQGLSVGGVLSIGGVDSGPMRHGAIVDNVLELDVVTGAGDLVTCSPTRRAGLFRAVLAGLGQCAVIVRATLKMVPAPAMALMVKLRYEDLQANLADLATLTRDARFNSFEQFATWENGRWIYEFQGAAYFDPPELPDVDALLSGLQDVAASRVIAPIPYLAWTLRLEPIVPTKAASTMVLFNGVVPEAAAPAFLEEVFARSADDLGESKHLMVMGSSTHMGMPLMPMPDAEVFYSVGLFRTAADDAQAAAFLADNRRLYDRLVAVGGNRYPWDAIPDLTRADWKRHFGAAWPMLARAKRRYDPAGILGPGHGIFGS